MWESAFEPSMLENPKIIVSCPSKYLVKELMDVLAENGVKWWGGKMPSKDNSEWENYEEETCYWIENKTMTYGTIHYADEEEDFENYIKCTFYGNVEDFEPAGDDELATLLGI